MLCGLGEAVKAKKLTKAGMAKNRAMIETYQTVRNRKGRWAIIRKNKERKREGNGIGLKQKNEKRDF